MPPWILRWNLSHGCLSCDSVSACHVLLRVLLEHEEALCLQYLPWSQACTQHTAVAGVCDEEHCRPQRHHVGKFKSRIQQYHTLLLETLCVPEGQSETQKETSEVHFKIHELEGRCRDLSGERHAHSLQGLLQNMHKPRAVCTGTQQGIRG